MRSDNDCKYGGNNNVFYFNNGGSKVSATKLNMREILQMKHQSFTDESIDMFTKLVRESKEGREYAQIVLNSLGSVVKLLSIHLESDTDEDGNEVTTPAGLQMALSAACREYAERCDKSYHEYLKQKGGLN